ncbi:MAG: DUF459 domain-containing protein, partial [Rhizobiaceae bacterium]|nr:DUF459 domain-containing protein [Rhizobiaceae bacterium]
GAAAAVVVEKSETAKTVLVVGDFLAGSLAGGLEDAVAKNPAIRVVGFSNGSSGFVRDDHFDWLKGIGPLLDEKKPAVVVAMMGSNDRQPIRSGGESLAALSAGWTSEYERRVEAFAKAVSERNIPLVWVGMPAFKFDRMSEDMAALNDIYRKVATTAAGGEFVDVWEGFVDANGAFTYSGPDIAGQTARLRNSDGITMTPAGSEKLAFFAEKPILRLLGTTAEGSAAVASLPSGEVFGPSAPALVNAANATFAPLIALTDPALDGGDALLGGGPSAGGSPDPSPRERLVVNGAPTPTAPGRADDFVWSAKTSAVLPRKPQDPVVFRGTVELSRMREPEARAPAASMPSLADAIVEEWTAQGRLEAARPEAAPASVQQTLAPSVPPTTPQAAAPVATSKPPLSASPFSEDQTRR